MKSPLPPLPKSVPSPLGPVPVKIVKRFRKRRRKGKGKKFTMGRYSLTRRVIEVSAKSALAVQWQTLYHEWTHMVLCDAGLHNVLGDEQQEVLCDTFGTARVLELRAGLMG